MTTYYLLNTTKLTTDGAIAAGTLVDSVTENTAAIQAAGGILWPSSDVLVGTASANALNAAKLGLPHIADAIMLAAASTSLRSVNDAQATSIAANAAAITTLQGLGIFSRTGSIARADLIPLGAGITTFSKNIGAVLPAGARLLGWSIGETFGGFDDAAHGDYGVELGIAATPALISASVDVKVGATGFPKAGTAGGKGYAGAPIGGLQLAAKMTGSVDLNTCTVGTVTFNVYFGMSN